MCVGAWLILEEQLMQKWKVLFFLGNWWTILALPLSFFHPLHSHPNCSPRATRRWWPVWMPCPAGGCPAPRRIRAPARPGCRLARKISSTHPVRPPFANSPSATHSSWRWSTAWSSGPRRAGKDGWWAGKSGGRKIGMINHIGVGISKKKPNEKLNLLD